LLSEHHGRRVHIRVPQRGDNVRLVELANKNAKDEAERVTTKEEKVTGALGQLLSMLNLPALHRIEAYDISNYAGTDIVASMTVHQDGKPYKKDYKRFKIKGLDDQDDYGSMRQVIERRFAHYLAGDKGFDIPPDALFIDGGTVHAKMVKDLLVSMELDFPVYGMVKDNRHRTRGLVTPQGTEVGIAATPAVFALVGRIQEETHRFAITYQKQLRSKKLTQSKLEAIPGIGKARRAELLKHFKSITAISKATVSELEEAVPHSAAVAVYHHFHQEAKP
ncbi:MAG: excinuclease ABC subunit UvrC, partial [Eubacteriales bacterium]